MCTNAETKTKKTNLPQAGCGKLYTPRTTTNTNTVGRNQLLGRNREELVVVRNQVPCQNLEEQVVRNQLPCQNLEELVVRNQLPCQNLEELVVRNHLPSQNLEELVVRNQLPVVATQIPTS